MKYVYNDIKGVGGSSKATFTLGSDNLVTTVQKVGESISKSFGRIVRQEDLKKLIVKSYGQTGAYKVTYSRADMESLTVNITQQDLNKYL